MTYHISSLDCSSKRKRYPNQHCRGTPIAWKIKYFLQQVCAPTNPRLLRINPFIYSVIHTNTQQRGTRGIERGGQKSTPRPPFSSQYSSSIISYDSSSTLEPTLIQRYIFGRACGANTAQNSSHAPTGMHTDCCIILLYHILPYFIRLCLLACLTQAA